MDRQDTPDTRQGVTGGSSWCKVSRKWCNRPLHRLSFIVPFGTRSSTAKEVFCCVEFKVSGCVQCIKLISLTFLLLTVCHFLMVFLLVRCQMSEKVLTNSYSQKKTFLPKSKPKLVRVSFLEIGHDYFLFCPDFCRLFFKRQK